MIDILGPAAVCRVSTDTVQRVRTGRDLAPLMLGCAATIAVGTAAYGATIGMWRGPLQASYAAIKLVILFGGLFLLTTVTNAVMGGLLRTGLSFRQVAACCLLGLAVTAAMLGALAPVSWFLVAHAPAATTDHGASLLVAHALLTAHVVVLGIAGVIGVRRVYGLLGHLVDDPAIARRVLWVWLVVEGLVGAELSWILRPFLGKPDLRITFLRSDAFDSSFFDEVGRMMRGLMGSAGPSVALAVVVIATLVIAMTLGARVVVRFRIHASGLTLQHVGSPQSFELAWSEIRFVRVAGTEVEVGRFDHSAMRIDVLVLGCHGEARARAAFEAIERARHGEHAPFRREALPSDH
jgi:hypothetical protein